MHVVHLLSNTRMLRKGIAIKIIPHFSVPQLTPHLMDARLSSFFFFFKSMPKSTDKRICFKMMRRGKIAKAVSNGVSYYYYSMLKNTPVKEIMAGNITRGLIKDVFEENIL